jgi:hypothetical protein
MSLGLLICISLSFSIVAQSHYPGQHDGKFVVKDKFIPALYSSLNGIRFTGPGKINYSF